MGTNRPDIYINPGTVTSGTTTPSTGYTYFRDAREWGACGKGVADSWPVLQKAIDDCINQGGRSLFIPRGCKISKPLLMQSTYNGAYVGFTLELFSDSCMWDSDATPTIDAQFNNNFILGIQRGKGVTIRNMWFRGQFVSPAGTDYEYFNRSFADFTDGVSRDNSRTPHCAIAIDPFPNSGGGEIPADGGWPGMSAYYRGDGSVNGSTSTNIRDCMTQGTVVGVCSSPNGYTRNAELTNIERVQFRFHKLCVSGGNDQEKVNTIRNCACWYASHTFFATNAYGGGIGNWDIDGVNIAGRMVRFMDNTENGFYPINVKNVYAESMGSWGTVTNFAGRLATSIENCIVNFAPPNQAGLISPLINAGGNVVFKNCTLRYYGVFNLPMPIQGDATYQDCSFSGYPVNLQYGFAFPRFVNCWSNSAQLGQTGIRAFVGGASYHTYGDWTLENYVNVYGVLTGNAGFHNTVSSRSSDIYNTVSETATVTTNGDGTASFTSANGLAYSPNTLVGFISGGLPSIFAIVTGISANDISLSYLPPTIPSGSYTILSYFPIYFTGLFIGNTISGTNTITSCVASQTQWWFTLAALVGLWIKNPYGGSKYIKITGVSGTTVFFFGSITATKTGAIFGNYSSQEIYTDYTGVNAFPAGYLVRRGDKIITQKGSENSIEYIITKGGFLSGDTDARQAQLQIAY